MLYININTININPQEASHLKGSGPQRQTKNDKIKFVYSNIM